MPPSPPSSGGGRRMAIAAGVAVVSALAALLCALAEIHRRRQRQQLQQRYVAALQVIAASAGGAAARKGQRARAAEGGEDDVARWRRRKGFFQRFFRETLGAVEEEYKFVHVTGTKGKGTVCELVRCGLVAQGKRVGTFTSPHLHTVRERIRIGDALIPPADFVRLWDVVQEALAREEGSERWCCFFDRVLALALAYFVERRVEYIVLEVGIGGRYDPTNFIETPAVSVVTSISYDHVELLGPTLEDIAWQKAGIVKQACPALTPATQPPAVLNVVRQEAAALHAPLHEVTIEAADDTPPIAQRHCYPENLALARTALRLLLPAADEAALIQGWARACWPGRFEAFQISRGKGKGDITVVLDVAHNVDSVALLLEEARRRFVLSSSATGAAAAGRRLWVLFGTGNDKDAEGMLARLLAGGGEKAAAATIQRLVFCQARHPRAVPVAALAALAARAKNGASSSNGALSLDGPVTPDAALERLLVEAAAEEQGDHGENDVVLLVGGSFYVVAAVRAHLAATRPWLFTRDDWAFHPDPPLAK